MPKRMLVLALFCGACSMPPVQVSVPPIQVIQPVAAAAAEPAGGRWQIVNPSPPMMRTIMLLDTATGQTWISCETKEAGTAWCDMHRGGMVQGPMKYKAR